MNVFEVHTKCQEQPPIVDCDPCYNALFADGKCDSVKASDTHVSGWVNVINDPVVAQKCIDDRCSFTENYQRCQGYVQPGIIFYTLEL